MCSCLFDIYVLLWLLSLKNSPMPLYIATRCVTFCVLSSNTLKSLIIASGCFPSWQFWGPMNLGFAYGWEHRGAARSVPEGRTLQVATLFSRCWARAWRLSSLIWKQRTQRWQVNYLRQVVENVIAGVSTVLEILLRGCLSLSNSTHEN